MNASFSILQKLKNQFFKSVSRKEDYHIAFAPFAFTLSNEDFYFLKNNISTGEEARKYLKEQSEFAFLSNSLLKKPNIWSMNGEYLLYNSYKEILNNALLIDPDVLTTDEREKLDNAKKVLFKTDGSDSAEYTKYKTFVLTYADIEKQLIDLKIKKNTIAKNDIAALEKWEVDFSILTNKEKELRIDWEVKGFKSIIDTAKKTYDIILFSKNAFIEKWTEAKNKLSESILTDESGVEFLPTTCIPNSICDYQAPIWKKVNLTKQELTQLTNTFTKEIPADVLLEFGNLEPELDAINFEYCILDILRSWFDETVINNKLWKYKDDTIKLSQGDDTMLGELPAYPVKIILSKNIEFIFTPNVKINEVIKEQLKNGTRLFFGPLLLKTIPLNLANDNIQVYKVQQVTTDELTILTKVALKGDKESEGINSKWKMMELISKQPTQLVQQKIQLQSLQAVPVNTSIPAVNILKPVVKEVSNKNFTASAAFDIKPVKATRVDTPLPASTYFAISGKILGILNEPIAAAEVQIMNKSNASTHAVLTLEDGTYRIENVEKASYQVKIKKAGFKIQEKNIELINNVQQDILLEKEPMPTESFQVMGVICKKLPKLPDPNTDSKYI